MHNTGRCLCGAVTFEVEGPPIRMAQCHCDACRRQSGTGHIVNAFFNSSQVKITGETKYYEFVADSGRIRHRHFCPNCGSRLFGMGPDTPERIGIAVGAFDNSDWFKPEVIVFGGQRPVWDHDHPEVEVREKS